MRGKRHAVRMTDQSSGQGGERGLSAREKRLRRYRIPPALVLALLAGVH
jgi:hypothetical protein